VQQIRHPQQLVLRHAKRPDVLQAEFLLPDIFQVDTRRQKFIEYFEVKANITAVRTRPERVESLIISRIPLEKE